MRSNIEERRVNEVKRSPCFMKWEQGASIFIVLVTEFNNTNDKFNGVVVYEKNSKSWDVGDWSKDFGISQFKPFFGKVLLEN